MIQTHGLKLLLGALQEEADTKLVVVFRRKDAAAFNVVTA
jgi:hypothetical protein